MNKKLIGLFTAFIMAVTVFAVPTSASFADESAATEGTVQSEESESTDAANDDQGTSDIVLGENSDGIVMEEDTTESDAVEKENGNEKSLNRADDSYDDDEEEESIFELTYKKITFSKKYGCNSSWYVYATSDSDAYIKSASSSKKSIAKVKVYNKNTSYASIVVTPNKNGKAGSTTIKVKSNNGDVRTVKVKVKKNYFKKNLKCSTWAYIPHRTRAIKVYSWPKAKVKLKIGGKTYVKRCNKNGRVNIKLRKGGYSAGKKYKIIAKKGKIKCKVTGKVYSNTYAYKGSLLSCSYAFPIYCYNVKKGDKLIARIGNKKYKKKITKNGNFYWTFYTKYTMRNYYHYQIVIKTKSGKKIYNSGQCRIYWN